MKHRFPVLLLSAGLIAAGMCAAPAAPAGPATAMPQLHVDDSPLSAGPSPVVTSYAAVVDPVQKAVVSVYSSKVVREPVPGFDNPMLRQFFGGQVPQRNVPEDGLGSGVIVSADGYILTNNHVVEGADELKVALPDGREFKARVIGADPKTDIAVIKIDAQNLPTVTLGDSDRLRVGDIVFAIGNPLNIGQTVTMGIVSATGRKNLGLLDGGYENFIQTDAAINMGNSGGALIDAKGRLIGINTAIVSTSRGNIGIGFAIPVNLASSIMHSLITTGTVQRGYLGVSVNPLTPDLAEALGVKGDNGVVVTDVRAGSPAAAAGMQRGDVITAINGKPLTSFQDLRLLIAQTTPGTKVSLGLVSNARARTVEVTLGTLADNGNRNEIFPGISVTPLTDDLRASLNIADKVSGLVVTDVADDSPFSDRFAKGMVIMEVNREPATDLPALQDKVIRPGRNLCLVYYRGVYSYLVVTVK